MIYANALGRSYTAQAPITDQESRPVLWLAHVVSTFGDFVYGVVGVRAEPQVIRIHAGSVIAAMKHASAVMAGAIRNRPDVDDVGHSVGTDMASVNTEGSITFLVSRSYPKPAGICLANFCPEPLLGLGVAMLRGAIARAMCLITRSATETLPTILAGSGVSGPSHCVVFS